MNVVTTLSSEPGKRNILANILPQNGKLAIGIVSGCKYLTLIGHFLLKQLLSCEVEMTSYSFEEIILFQSSDCICCSSLY